MKKSISIIMLALAGLLPAKATDFNTPGAGNPLIPGYFADPTVVKFGDTYYIYATTDGNGGGLGPSQVWVSKDFANWTIQPMNWPNTHFIWAPDVMKANDGSFRMFYCQPCQIYEGVAETPRGPWKNLLGEEEAVLIPDRFITNAITLDGQTFVDDDGSTYIYFGTWGIYKGFGCGVAKMTPDLKGFTDKRLIVNTEITDFFEAPFVFKKDSIYYFTYSSGSCHDHTYRVQYATSTKGPMGPYTFADNNPILSTNADSTIHGPGHHSILKEGEDYYIVYHRHNLPGSTRGMHRQIAVDKLEFGPNNTIKKVEGGHKGIGALAPLTNPYPNIAFRKPSKVSSSYGEKFRADYATDDNNATLWRPATCNREWIEIDLEKEEEIRRIWTQFEYATSFYQYIIETSLDGINWSTFSDKQQNQLAGSPMVDYGSAKARYVRLTITGNEKNGLQGAIWNLKIFSNAKIDPPQKLIHLNRLPEINSKDATNQHGMLGGTFAATTSGVESSFNLPHTLSQSGFTLSFKFNGSGAELAATNIQLGEIGNLARLFPKSLTRTGTRLHTLAFVSDGKVMTLYINGRKEGSQKLTKQQQTQTKLCLNTNGTITDLRLYNWQQEPSEILFDLSQPPIEDKTVAVPRNGKLIELNADDFTRGSNLMSLPNKGLLKGKFEAIDSPIRVELKANRNAFAFNSKQGFRSTFSLPETMIGNAPYSVETWVMNPEQEDQELIIDLIDGHGELERIGIGVGKERNSGIVSHNGSYEDMSCSAIKPDNKWHHLVVTFDGFMERIYWDGKEVRHKDLVLRLPKSNTITIGQSNTRQGHFSGWLHSLRVYDTTLSPQEIAKEASSPASSDELILFSPIGSSFDTQIFGNEGAWGGKSTGNTGEICIKDGLLAWKGAIEFSDIKALEAAKTVQISFYHEAKATKLLNWADFELLALPKGIEVRIGTQTQSYPNVLHGKGWNTVTLNMEQNEILINGKSIGRVPFTSIALPQDRVTLGDNRKGRSTTLFELQISKRRELSQPTLHSMLKAESYHAAAQSLTPELVSINVSHIDGRSLNETESISLRNNTTGRVIPWSTQTSLLDFFPAIGRPNNYTVWVSNKNGASVQLPEITLRSTTEGLNNIANNLSQLKKETKDKGVITLNETEAQLSSANCNNHYTSSNCGPLLYADVVGNFVATVEVSDFTGMKERRPIGFNEGGLMVMRLNDTSDEKSETTQDMVHIGVFPHYNVGNILTNVSAEGRFQSSNNQGWEYDRYLQIERKDELFIIRTSHDGVHWKEAPGSPVIRKDFDRNQPLRVGVYQVTYSENQGAVTFRNLQIWKPTY